MPEELTVKQANRIMENAFATKESLLRRVSQLERVIVKARREFRKGNDQVGARAWLFRVEIDEDRYTD